MSSRNLALQKLQETILTYSQGNPKHFHFTRKPPAVCAKVLINTVTLPTVSLAPLSAVPQSSCDGNASLGRKAKRWREQGKLQHRLA